MTPTPVSLPRAAAALAVVAVAFLVTATAASAHTELRASSPEQGSTVNNLSEVRLEFTGDLLDIGNELTIVDAAGTATVLEPEYPSGNAVTATVDQPLAAGDAQLQWRVVAADGHALEGVLEFTYAGEGANGAAPAPEPEVTGPAPATSAPEPEASPSAVPVSAQLPAEVSDEVPGWVWPVIALAALGGAAVALAVTTLRRRA